MLEDILERRVGNDATIPIVPVAYPDRRKAGRKRAARHDMIGPEGLFGRVEIGHVATLDIDRANREAYLATVQPVEIHEPEKCVAQRCRVVEADRGIGPRPLEHRRRHAWREESRNAHEHGFVGAGLVERQPQPGRNGSGGEEARERIAGTDELPELVQPLDTILRPVADDQRRIDRTDGDSRHIIRPEPPLMQLLEHSTLIGTERATALQQQDLGLVTIRKAHPHTPSRPSIEIHRDIR